MPPKRAPKPRRAGRKPLPPGEARSRRIVLLVRPGDGEEIDRAAGGADYAAAWAARVVIEAARKVNA